MSEAPTSALIRIEEWRRKASNYSATDRLGNLMSRSLEVLKCLSREKISLEDLEYALDSLEMENNLSRKHDKTRATDDFRCLVYGLIESIFTAVNALKANDAIKSIKDCGSEDEPPSKKKSKSPSGSKLQEPTSSSSFERLFNETSQSACSPGPISHVIIKEEELRLDSPSLDFSVDPWSQFVAQQQQHLVPQLDLSYDQTAVQAELQQQLPQLPGSLGYTVDESGMYKCNYCDITDKCSSTMSQHLRTHAPERPYGCEKCGKRFLSKTWLQNHINSHLTEGEERARFVCATCGQKFTDRSNLRRHVRKQHEPLQCSTCGETFVKVADMNEHMLLVHNTV